MIAPGRVKIIPPLQQTYGSLDGTSVPVYQVFFSIDGKGSYSVMVPRDGFRADVAMAAVLALAEQIIATMDAF